MAMSEKWRETSPYGLRRYANEFITVGHDALNSHRKRNISSRSSGYDQVQPSQIVPFPIYFNFLHGIELGLKAYLLNIEALTLDELKKSKEFGHNLANLVDKALDYGLRNDCPELTESNISVIRFSSETYTNKRLEYIRIGGEQIRPIDEVADAADTLISSLKQLPMKTA